MSAAPTPDELIIEADGGSRGNPGPAGYGAVVRDGATQEILAERAEFLGITTNNVAEYRGLIAGLRAAADINPNASVLARMDSKLVVEQMSGRWKIKHPDMQELAAEARTILPAQQVTYVWIPRAKNAAADGLANEAMDGGSGTRIANDYAMPRDTAVGAEPDDVLDPSPAPTAPTDTAIPNAATTIALVRSGRAPVASLRNLGSGAWADLPAPTWVASSPADRAKATAREVASALGVSGQARSLEPAFETPERANSTLRDLVTAHAGATGVITTHRAVIAALVGTSLEIPENRWEDLHVPSGSLTILRFQPTGKIELIALGLLA